VDPAWGDAAAMTGRLAVADLAAVLGDLRQHGLRGDGLAWVHGCRQADLPGLAGLLALGQPTGTSVLVSTADGAAVDALAGLVAVAVTSGPVDRRAGATLAGLVPFRSSEDLADAAQALSWQGRGELTIAERGARLRAGGQIVPGPWGGAA
jgi:hypothetical protein